MGGKSGKMWQESGNEMARSAAKTARVGEDAGYPGRHAWGCDQVRWACLQFYAVVKVLVAPSGVV